MRHPVRQAIATKYLSVTNYRPGRVKATAEAGSVTLSWDHSLDSYDNHHAAAVALASRFGWPTDVIGGGLPGGGYVFVYPV
jgi:hypothetical protein